MRVMRVVRWMPMRAAAPSAPPTRPLLSVRARTISSRCFWAYSSVALFPFRAALKRSSYSSLLRSAYHPDRRYHIRITQVLPSAYYVGFRTQSRFPDRSKEVDAQRCGPERFERRECCVSENLPEAMRDLFLLRQVRLSTRRRRYVALGVSYRRQRRRRERLFARSHLL